MTLQARPPHHGIEQALELIRRGPAFSDRPFCGAVTHGRVHDMANILVRSCPPENGDRPLLAVCTEDRAAIAAALLAALAGGPVLVFPPDISDPALAELKAATGVHLALADPARTLPEGICPVFPDPCGLPGAGADMSPPLPGGDDPLLRLYTGGSTGKPAVWSKTVRNIMAEAAFHVRAHRVTPEDVVLATVPAYHIYGLLFSVAVPLLSGASVIDRTPGFPHEITETAGDSGATILISVPAHYKALKGQMFGAHRLRLAFSSAGSLDGADEAAFRLAAGVPVMEVYGSTETGGIAFRCRAVGEEVFRPFEPIEAWMDRDELRVRSPFVSPEAGLDDRGLFLVQDRVDPRPDGSFVLLGRTDNIVKVAGNRVDLDRVRVVLKQAPGVRDAVVQARPVPSGREFEIQALVEGTCDRAGLRAFFSGRLEPAAHPRRFRIVDRMPVTRAGKYDRCAIESLLAAGSED
jgi:acyl-coenzyme A synthetase/AMP-(fatty) acid ligase